ncbi:succinate-semialdehyde dehydrogenase [Spizellomyces punctatus DAOM BR117]|uniref:Succinate-semialdehyde dehydrogenase n=1 Tax=Spizellomyces punctatus (strain DAOM BR117) TaxID=645134 RepID=A0A0L0H6X2_SPIPD|nr:succinate-semialdehyde dehydrogenase [Spizellomyces punctatus DAOM BR117]KNC96478.1 succinate-semialdehyde dehydrogenase [Spizellomyces punctatus DAOM BR117]|eukprot:XP_016604518.1 succinate-semialdehyde dehydrogenase [Spizellomyces punctatus DAOM BR117]
MLLPYHRVSFGRTVQRGHSHISLRTISGLQRADLFRDSAYIGGKWTVAESGAKHNVVDPANLEIVAAVPNMSSNDANVAIKHAQKAQAEWKRTTARQRANILRRWFDLLHANRDDLATIMTTECGKPLAEARGEVAYGASFIQWFAEEAPRAYGDIIPQHAVGRRLLAIKQPIGVVGAITPWNFPIAMVTRKVAPALAAGCSIVLKPAPETPLSALALARLAEEAGVPPGVFNVVTASKENTPEIGKELTTNSIVRKITFTGSTQVGKILAAQAASTVKRVSLELGGNAAFIVFDDADLDAAVEGCIASKYRNTGQTCVSANRIYVQAGIYDEFAERLAKRIRRMNVGHGLQAGVDVGPLISKEGWEKVSRHVSDALSKGAVAIAGGKPHALGNHFYEPTVLTGLQKNMALIHEETFGPVAGLYKFETEAEVVELANDTPFGLAGYFFSRDVGRIFRVAESLEVGMVGVNEGMISTECAPFGGVKESGMGREGSKYGLEDYLEIKYICMGGIQE